MTQGEVAHELSPATSLGELLLRNHDLDEDLLDDLVAR